ncbi:MAG: flagellar type III secretion system pore protein FliP [Deltaproteobacteria bacterium]|nr:flagellar type III secretion system pore protein FliP [Deltaproteobacteria bacterium]MBW2050833.1 flagellar type III secretion system pore protein FliP [Deltaproteobacteria bacterium]MBW2140057.1 flagellar type III secretion system pore protein FliP [Deltaproteobacteria bacterium]MBW2322077.1 flagellar type III secretion system pore protein FliP [Deltaproteobacteria bacterium]
MILVIMLVLAAMFLGTASAKAISIPTINIELDEAETPDQVAAVIKILFILTVLTLAPSILIMMTSFTRLAVVFHFLRQAMGTQQSPPNQVIVGLALFLTIFIMAPIWNKVNQQAIQPYLNREVSEEKALELASLPIKEFMFKQTRENDLALFMNISNSKRPANKEEVPITALIPAFIISELKTAFTIGFILYIPFLIIDMVVASVLLSMGMMMLPPIMISLPFKLMLFVLVDGWHLLVGSMVRSFG